MAEDNDFLERLGKALEESCDISEDIVTKVDGGCDLSKLEEPLQKLANLTAECLHLIKIAKKEVVIGEHQHHPELQAVAGGKFIPGSFS